MLLAFGATPPARRTFLYRELHQYNYYMILIILALIFVVILVILIIAIIVVSTYQHYDGGAEYCLVIATLAWKHRCRDAIEDKGPHRSKQQQIMSSQRIMQAEGHLWGVAAAFCSQLKISFLNPKP